jgi:hypothetical protein
MRLSPTAAIPEREPSDAPDRWFEFVFATVHKMPPSMSTRGAALLEAIRPH